ncbi:MAG: hypothetical protein ABGY24_09755, partial [bacterium]
MAGDNSAPVAAIRRWCLSWWTWSVRLRGRLWLCSPGLSSIGTFQTADSYRFATQGRTGTCKTPS